MFYLLWGILDILLQEGRWVFATFLFFLIVLNRCVLSGLSQIQELAFSITKLLPQIHLHFLCDFCIPRIEMRLVVEALVAEELFGNDWVMRNISNVNRHRISFRPPFSRLDVTLLYVSLYSLCCYRHLQHLVLILIFCLFRLVLAQNIRVQFFLGGVCRAYLVFKFVRIRCHHLGEGGSVRYKWWCLTNSYLKLRMEANFVYWLVRVVRGVLEDSVWITYTWALQIEIMILRRHVL